MKLPLTSTDNNAQLATLQRPYSTAQGNTVSTGSTVIATGGNIKSGQAAYDSGTGFWLGSDSGVPKFSIGDSSGDKMTWDGSTLSVTGNLTATTGTIGGWTIGATTITGGNVTLDSTGNIRAGQTAYDTGVGFWLGMDGGVAKLSVGDSDADGITGTGNFAWNGSTLSLTGKFTIGSPTVYFQNFNESATVRYIAHDFSIAAQPQSVTDTPTCTLTLATVGNASHEADTALINFVSISTAEVETNATIIFDGLASPQTLTFSIEAGTVLTLSSDGDAVVAGDVTADTFIGALTGNATTATAATNVTVANEATDTTCFPVFVTAATGDLGVKTNANMSFNSNTGVVTLASAVLTTADINGGTVDGATIGATTPAAGTFTNVTATGVVSVPDGSATAPSIKVGDEQNGLYSHAANALSFATAGQQTALLTNSSGTRTFTVTSGSVGATAQITASQSDNTSASSTALVNAQVGGTSAGDAYFRASISGVENWSFGLDNSDSDSFKISNGVSLGTNDYLKITTAGVTTITSLVATTADINAGTIDGATIGGSSAGAGTFTDLTANGNTTLGSDAADTLTINAETVSQPNIPAFLAYNSATDTNQTGAGATVTVDFDTEVFDQSGDFSADTFTAPATGKYSLGTQVVFTAIPAGATTVVVRIVTSNRTYSTGDVFVAGTFTQKTVFLSAIADMDSGDTASVTCTISGGAGNTASISGSATLVTYFSGIRVA